MTAKQRNASRVINQAPRYNIIQRVKLQQSWRDTSDLYIATLPYTWCSTISGRIGFRYHCGSPSMSKPTRIGQRRVVVAICGTCIFVVGASVVFVPSLSWHTIAFHEKLAHKWRSSHRASRGGHGVPAAARRPGRHSALLTLPGAAGFAHRSRVQRVVPAEQPG